MIRHPLEIFRPVFRPVPTNLPSNLASTLATALVAAALATGGAGLARADDNSTGDSRYDFSEDWFSDNIPQWERFLEPYRGAANLNYLEIGVYEGRATVWMAENILTHEKARVTALDVFPKDLEERFLANMKASGFAGEIRVLVGPSQKTLRKLDDNAFDIIYIDGSHEADDVLVDAVLSWPLLRQRGMLIFDDYQWQPELPAELRPRPAIDAFVTMFRREIEVVDRGYQLMIRKVENPCGFHFSRCTVFGRYLYLWTERSLVDSRKPHQPIELAETERDLIESLSRDARPGEVGIYVPKRLIRSAEFISLRKKLRLVVEDQLIVRVDTITR